MPARFLRIFVATATLVVGAAGCTHAHGPHLQLVSPPGAAPNFGDAPNRSEESTRRGTGGGGGTVTEMSQGHSGGGLSPASIVGGVVGVGAAAAAVGTGLVECKPGSDAPSEPKKANLCSGERAPPPTPP